VFQADELIAAYVKLHTSEAVFKARGGTNIEAALKELGIKMKALTQKVRKETRKEDKGETNGLCRLPKSMCGF
jgi:hypothetical protein